MLGYCFLRFPVAPEGGIDEAEAEKMLTVCLKVMIEKETKLWRRLSSWILKTTK